MDDTLDPIPGHVGVRTRRWLEHLRDEYEWTPSEWRIALLAADAYDRAQTARRTLGREGQVITSPRGELKPHPATVIARDSAALYAKLIAQLGIDQADDEPEPRVDRRYAHSRNVPRDTGAPRRRPS